ncbi:SWI/SNF-related matrix-associated actin-dependent regulator of chromatin subfamily A containing DEAD/H box 1 homolog isoform X2 [Agrilus planipennis]|uniref:SWI/SNF-related matrix-associated actin-dependent regulator of chromatin subfamily A containing DEAD/H box 1 homolog n=1 Tax=Agrilus planipennis TaxID=224129 RepID=A0A1W4WYT4_AGRPL|nr:SWI/SNF-related matrix-associated actin-dependent regulator of chromatin subfamily A containing DEAD/H box 1 homolog isoform X2 [Agrilus planipennis]
MAEDNSPNLLNLPSECNDQEKETKIILEAVEGSRRYVVVRKEVGKEMDPTTTTSSNSISTKKVPIIREYLLSSEEQKVRSSKEVESAQNGVTNNPRSKQKPQLVLERERQMKFLKEKFNDVDSLVLHDVLSRFDFDVDKAIEELNKSRANCVTGVNYQTWKQLQQQTVPKPPITLKQLPVSNNNDNKKRENTQDLQSKNRKRIKQMRSDEDSDTEESDYDKNEFKDSRVFDSDEESDAEINNDLTGDKRTVLDFFQTATNNELQLMNYCSKKKADIIIELRPFEGWIDLVQKLQNNKNLSPDLLNSAQQVLATRNNIRLLMRKCTNLSQQMERAVAAGAGVKVQPSILNSSLKLTSYQMVGLNWLAVMHIQGVNGILADEMGLGKTVQVIAFLAHLKEIRASKVGIPHLIIVPSSTLDNWRSEFERWCPTLRIFMYYGNIEERRQYRMRWNRGEINNYDVIVTTYSMVTNTSEERKMFKSMQMHYVVFDEAHMLKNMNTQRYENLIKIRAMKRLLLTGTPLQNNLLELMSLLNFVMPSMFSGKTDDLKSLFQKNAKTKEDREDLPTFEKEQIEQAKRIMKPFVLRRLKRDVLQDLPNKSDKVEFVPMVPTQKEQYEELVQSFQNIGKQEYVSTAYNGMAMMTDLRKLANHPLLMRYFYQIDDLREIAELLAKDPGYKDTVVQYIVDDLVFMSDFEIFSLTKQFQCLKKFELADNLITTSGKFLFLDRILPTLKAGGHRVLIFSQYVIMLNIMEDYLCVRNHSYLRLDGSTPVNIRQQLIDQFTQDPEIFIFLLSTKAGGLGINLTAADTVIIHDIDFNPYNDKQAEDRCHRMGQQNPVNVIRLISQGTIEEGMWQMNQEKLKLEKEITAEEAENSDVKSVVRLLSSALGIDSSKATNLVSPKKKL